MIEALKSDEIISKVGGRFRVAVLVQKRLVDVTFGAPLLVERGNMTLMEAVVQEVLEGKISLEMPGEGPTDPLAAIAGSVADEADDKADKKANDKA